VPETIGVILPAMSTPPLSGPDLRAAAEAYRELGPEYGDAVVESFLAKVEKVIEARVDARLADRLQVRRRRVDPATLAKRRLVLMSMGFGSVAVGIPLSFVLLQFYRYDSDHVRAKLVLVWLLVVAVYAVASALLLRPWRRDHD
jgi:hypothetical protein